MKKRLFLLLLVLSIMFIGTVKAEDIVYEEYKVGDMVTIDNINYYTLLNSGINQDYIVLVRQIPLMKDEVSSYLESANLDDAITVDEEGFIKVKYYTGDYCYSSEEASCKRLYKNSLVKQLVDYWAENNFDNKLAVADNQSAYILSYDLIMEAYNQLNESPSNDQINSVMEWLQVGKQYWINDINFPSDMTNSFVGIVNANGELYGEGYNNLNYILPVINFQKKYLQTNEETIVPISNKDDSSIKVNTPNTLLNKSFIVIALGALFVAIGIMFIYKVGKKKK